MSEVMPGRRVVIAVYALYALGLVSWGAFALGGLCIAHAKAPGLRGTVEGDHLDYLIVTGWYTAIALLAGFLTLWFLIGIPIMIGAAVWYFWRIAKGALALNDGLAP